MRRDRPYVAGDAVGRSAQGVANRYAKKERGFQRWSCCLKVLQFYL